MPSLDCGMEVVRGALDNRVVEYPVAAEIREDYKLELHTWMSNGWLVPYKEDELGPPKGLILLMAVLQQHKSKVRPVMNFRQLNCHVDVFTANVDVCAAKSREWRQKGSNVSLLDLKRAYLQMRVQKTLSAQCCHRRRLWATRHLLTSTTSLSTKMLCLRPALENT